jgi:phenylalanyl-tRNA synthetase beta subunit
MAFGAPDRTLRGEEVEAAVNGVVGAVEGGLGGRIRA